ncbi:hypothetical protein EDF57_1091 [Novosphingobium sp. PhB55]|uniref:hypothetical protein n=1 Tax=Novosphingobium sp. PhB55 TaxID=2485106 RepID=UPI0010ECF831|nr:hypothetical protein [Novosphingobium sp. PhB55]TDW61444.1 hypothetical protein EDF57_1091 [Novosphingobium sp. PhB55]
MNHSVTLRSSPSTGAAAAARNRRMAVAARVLAGTLGAYGLTAQITVVLSFILARTGMERAEAVVAATLASFAMFAAISMAIFHARSAGWSWLWLTISTVSLCLLQWSLSPLS